LLFDLNAAELGLLTSVYFLTFAAAQLPLGVAIDRFGPSRVQGILLTIAAVGALVFATASGIAGLIVGRALIGFGVAAALIAGLKAIADEFPQERLPLLNGLFVAFGAAGAISATAPLDWLLARLDWRSVFILLSLSTLFVALLFPLASRQPRGLTGQTRLNVRAIYGDPRFWRFAPLSASCIGSAWALQGLWMAPWLADVALLGRVEIMEHLLIMGVALCLGALLAGLVFQSVRSLDIGPAPLFALIAFVFIAAELALICRADLPTEAICSVLAAMGGATVLSYALLTDLFPREVRGQANAALNILHIGGAFAIQTGIGFIVSFWERDGDGRYPPQSYQIAFLFIVVLQLVALLWFLRPHLALANKPAHQKFWTPRPSVRTTTQSSADPSALLPMAPGTHEFLPMGGSAEERSQ
jgi:MFS family permease